jgi:hypothetical protein
MRVAFRTFPVCVLMVGLTIPSLSVWADIRITQAVIDGKEHPLPAFSGEPAERRLSAFRFSASAKRIVFHFSETTDDQHALRLKHKLEGYDSGWRDQPSQMVVLLRLLNKSGRILAGDQSNFSGETPGWNGRADSSPLNGRSMTLRGRPALGVFHFQRRSGNHRPNGGR